MILELGIGPAPATPVLWDGACGPIHAREPHLQHTKAHLDQGLREAWRREGQGQGPAARAARRREGGRSRGPAIDSATEFRGEAQGPLDQLQHGHSFCSVSDDLRWAEVGRAHHRLAVRLWGSSMCG